MGNSFDIEIKNDFINEALINLEEVEVFFMELETTSDPQSCLHKIFRLAHNLKGGSRAVGFGAIAELTHELENLVFKLQQGSIKLNENIVTLLLKINDRIVEMLTILKGNHNEVFDNIQLVEEIKAWNSGKQIESRDDNEKVLQQHNEKPSISEVEIQQTTASDLLELTEAKNIINTKELDSRKEAPLPHPAFKTKEKRESEDKESKDDKIVRVNITRIDLLNDYVGELIVLETVVQQQINLKNHLKTQAALRQMIKISRDIQSLSMGLRMLPVKPLCQKLQRVVRDTAQTLNKQVHLEVLGDQIDIDKSVLDRLSDPLIHILRNAVDHGLETTEDRVKLKKATRGVIELKFSNEGNYLLVEIKDDGRGINPEIILKKAIEKKIISENQSLSEKQITHLIFHPGFSTKSEASEISGRGVGMDVVKTNIDKVGGKVDVTSVVGKGSVFRIQIPLTLAVLDGLILSSGSQRYAVPLNLIQETINLATRKINYDASGIGPCIDIRSTIVPIMRIEEALQEKGQRKLISKDSIAVIVIVEGRVMGLVADEILHSQQIVIKPFGNGILPQKGWIGSCVLGDGMPALIINPVELLQGKVKEQFRDENQGQVS